LGIDLNFGCPAPTVNRHDGGATLLKYPTRIFEMISTVRQAVPDRYPVSVKMRLGWDQVESIFENSKIAEEAGASWLTIHARTRMQSYQPPVHWSLIGEVRERLSIPVVANGDIWNFDDFKQCQRITGCEHYMIGRGVMGSPSLVFQIAQDLGILKDISENVLGGPLTTWPRGHWPEDPVLWKEFFTVVIRILRHHEFHDRTIIKRIKQWHKYAGMTRRQPLPWFDRIKVVDRLDVLMELMTDLKS
jgi:tRNA-dihydrouridine synthase